MEKIYIDEIMGVLKNKELFDYEAGCFGGNDSYTSKNGRVEVEIAHEIHTNEVDAIKIDNEDVLNDWYLVEIELSIWNKVLEAIK